MALSEQVAGRPIPYVITLRARNGDKIGGGVAVATSPPSARLEKIDYARRAVRVSIRHRRGRVVAIIEIVSPGNKDSRNALRTFVERATDILNQGIHLLVVDLFPPTPRDPFGMHKAIWDELAKSPFTLRPASRSSRRRISPAKRRPHTWNRSGSVIDCRRYRFFFPKLTMFRPRSKTPTCKPGTRFRHCSRKSWPRRLRLAKSAPQRHVA